MVTIKVTNMLYNKRKLRLEWRDNKKKYYMLVIGTVVVSTFSLITMPQTKAAIISPLPVSGSSVPPTITPTPTLKPAAGLRGKASYYSKAGCLGCSETFAMANGEILDDNALTVAYNRAPLNSTVKVTNIDNGKSIYAKVTDTGGFERHGRIIDLTVGTKEAIGCNDLCNVEVEK